MSNNMNNYNIRNNNFYDDDWEYNNGYFGEFKDNQRHGLGIFYYANGSIYLG